MRGSGGGGGRRDRRLAPTCASGYRHSPRVRHALWRGLGVRSARVCGLGCGGRSARPARVSQIGAHASQKICHWGLAWSPLKLLA
jgi:hypothetical protein